MAGLSPESYGSKAGQGTLAALHQEPKGVQLYLESKWWGHINTGQPQGLSVMIQLSGCPKPPTALHPPALPCIPPKQVGPGTRPEGDPSLLKAFLFITRTHHGLLPVQQSPFWLLLPLKGVKRPKS